MEQKYKIIISIILKIMVILFTLTGVYFIFYGDSGLKGSVFLYFAVQSSIWISIVDIILIVFQIKKVKDDFYTINPKLQITHQVFTTMSTFSGLVNWLILIPMFFISDGKASGLYPFSIGMILLGIIIPLIVMVDFICFTIDFIFTQKEAFYSLIPLGTYFLFTIIGYVANINFGEGLNYPYFFLNYGSPAGTFWFSSNAPYFMGTFYWLLILLALAIGISYLYIVIVDKITAKFRNKKF